MFYHKAPTDNLTLLEPLIDVPDVLIVFGGLL